VELRCNGRIHGETQGDCSGLLEVQCHHWRCIYPHKRALVLHTFDLATGLIKHTSQPFRNPLKGNDNGHY
jgi:hypothetical protein